MALSLVVLEEKTSTSVNFSCVHFPIYHNKTTSLIRKKFTSITKIVLKEMVTFNAYHSKHPQMNNYLCVETFLMKILF